MSERSEPQVRLPSLSVWYWKEETSEHMDFKARKA